MKGNSCKSYDNFFKNFAHPTRFQIILALKNNPLSVTQLAKKTGLEQSQVSHTLKNMVQCNILEVKKKGRQRIYSLNKKTVLPLLQIVEKHVKKYCLRECPRLKNEKKK